MLKHLKSPAVNILSLGIIGLLLFIPLYPKFPLLNVMGTYVAIRAEDVLVVFLLLIWFFHQLKLGFPSLKDKVGKLIIFYWIVGFLSLLSALFITKNIVPHIAVLHFLRRVEYMSLFFIALASIKSLENVKSYLWVILLSTAGVIAYGVGQKFFGWPVVSTMNEEFSKGLLLQLTEWTRISSTFAGHYDLAAFMVLVLAVLAAFLFGLRNKIAKTIVMIVSFAAFYVLILTASRVSFIAYLIATVFVFVMLKKHWWLIPVLIVSFTIMLFSGDIAQRYALTFNIDTEKISQILSPQIKEEVVEEVIEEVSIPIPIEEAVVKKVTPTPTPTLPPSATMVAEVAELEEWKPTTELAVKYSGGIRFDVEWPRSLRSFYKNPFLGTGYSSVTLATDNDYLRLIAETGFLGFVAFFLIFLELLRRVIYFLKKTKPGLARTLVIGISGAILGLLANAVFIDVFESSKVAFFFWILIGILIGIMKVSLPKEESKNV